MPEFFSSDGNVVLQFLAIFSVIVVVMGAGYLIYRRFAGRGMSLSARAANRARQPRLGIVDIYELDRQRQLILLRRDNVEHLLLVGGPNDVVVERNVQRGAGARLPGDALGRSEPGADDATAAGQPSLFPPRFDMPVVVPQPLPGSDRQPDAVAPRLDPALFEPEPEAEPRGAEPRGAEAQTARGRAGRILRRTPPPLVNPRPDIASARQPAAADPSAPPQGQIPPVLPSGGARSVDPAVLSDMTRQLEVALRRASSAVTPPPGQAAAPGPEPLAAALPAPQPDAAQAAAAPEPQRPPNPIAAGMAASQVLNPPPRPGVPASPPERVPPAADAAAASAAASEEPFEPTSPPAVAAPPPTPPAPAKAAPPPKPPAPAQAAAAPKPSAPAQAAAPPPKPPPPASPAKPAPKPAEPQAAAAEPAAKSESAPDPNPFSVEEIEAEFARLLGRPLDKKN